MTLIIAALCVAYAVGVLMMGNTLYQNCETSADPGMPEAYAVKLLVVFYFSVLWPITVVVFCLAGVGKGASDAK